MENPLSNVFAFLLVILLLVFVPLYDQAKMGDKMIQNNVDVITNRFQKEVRSQGYVSKALYDELVRELGNTKRDYEIKMVHREVKYYPLAATDPNYSPDKPYSVETLSFSEAEILKQIYTDKKDYKMQIGDDFTVTVADKSGFNKGANLFLNLIKGNDGKTNVIFARYGGMVENQL